MTRHQIGSAEFTRRLSVILLQNTVHFVHELLNFAQSPFEMDEYDRRISYERSAASNTVRIDIGSDRGGGSTAESEQPSTSNGDVLVDLISRVPNAEPSLNADVVPVSPARKLKFLFSHKQRHIFIKGK